VFVENAPESTVTSPDVAEYKTNIASLTGGYIVNFTIKVVLNTTQN